MIWPGGFQAFWLPHWGTESVGQSGRVGKAFCLVLPYADEAVGLVILLPPAVGAQNEPKWSAGIQVCPDQLEAWSCLLSKVYMELKGKCRFHGEERGA